MKDLTRDVKGSVYINVLSIIPWINAVSTVYTVSIPQKFSGSFQAMMDAVSVFILETRIDNLPVIS